VLEQSLSCGVGLVEAQRQAGQWERAAGARLAARAKAARIVLVCNERF